MKNDVLEEFLSEEILSVVSQNNKKAELMAKKIYEKLGDLNTVDVEHLKSAGLVSLKQALISSGTPHIQTQMYIDFFLRQGMLNAIMKNKPKNSFGMKVEKNVS